MVAIESESDSTPAVQDAPGPDPPRNNDLYTFNNDTDFLYEDFNFEDWACSPDPEGNDHMDRGTGMLKQAGPSQLDHQLSNNDDETFAIPHPTSL